MTGSELLIGALIGAVIVTLALGARLTRVGRPGRATTVTRSVSCPITGTAVTVRFREETAGEPFEVLGCAAFEPPAGMTCARVCLHRVRVGALAHTMRGA